MNYPIIDDYKYDINQLFKENIIPNELRVIEDGINVIVPKNAPFFVNSLSIKTKEGNDLVLGKDYRIFRLMSKLSGLAATEIACLIEIINPAVKAIFMKYHTVGNTSLFDSSLIELVNNAANDQRLIKYKNILNKPVVFTPTAHKHSLIYDMVVWEDVIDTFTNWMELLSNNSTNYIVTALNAYSGVIQAYIDNNSRVLLDNLAAHTATYNEHGLTATQVNLNKVENLKTATLREVLQGRNDRHYTTDNLVELIKKYGYNTDNLLQSNLLPISFYGNTSFIPPGIAGSFEGLGSLSESGCFCIETDGTISLLTNHFDGRVNGLYFTIVTGYPNNIKMNYQSYHYDHQLLTSLGITPTQVAKTDGRDLLMCGVGGAADWFIALTNGTMNPDHHTMAKIDMSGLEAARYYDQYLSAYLMGDYVVIIQTGTTGGYMGENTRRFYRIPVSDIKTKSVVTPVPFNINNPRNIDGVASTGTNTLLLADQQLDTNGKVTKAVYTFSAPYLSSGSTVFARSSMSMCVPSPSKANTFLLKFYNLGYFNFDNGVNSQYAAYLPIDFTYEINILTGNMTWINDSGQWPLNLTGVIDGDSLITQAQVYQGTWFNNLGLLFGNQNAVVMDDGNILVASSGAARTPHQLGLYNTGATIPSDTISKSITTKNFPNIVEKFFTESITSPLPYSLQPTNVGYDADGELFTAQGKIAGSGYQTFYRKVTGDYAIRNTVTNVNVANVYSRPLSNDVYTTNIDPNQGRISVSGDAAFLTAAGLTNLGDSGFNVGVSGKLWRNTKAGWTGALADRSVRLVRSFTKVLGTSSNYIYTPTGFTTFPDALVKSLASQLIPAQYQNTPDYFVQIMDMTHWAGAGVTKRPVCIMIQYLDLSTFGRRCVIASLATTYNTTNTTEYVVSGATIISSADNLVRGQQIYASATAWPILYSITYQASGIAELYYNSTNNTIKVVMNSFGHTYHTGNYANPAASFELDGTTLVIRSGGGYNAGQEGLNTIGVVPKVGIASKLIYTTAGANAEFMQASGVTYCRITCYPDPAWSVFFQTTVDVIFNSKTYTLEAGMVDLRTVTASPGNKTFYIYVRIVNGAAAYVIESAKTFDSIYNIWIGTVTTNANQIISIDRNNAFLLNGSRISRSKVGGAIPATTGDITDNGQLYWMYPDEIIQS